MGPPAKGPPDVEPLGALSRESLGKIPEKLLPGERQLFFTAAKRLELLFPAKQDSRIVETLNSKLCAYA